ncbi:hypothetical protein GCM10010306_103510 [Streptomyces umbrinus]|nr:hypothetical protein GCM10010306_103510 [Streptomyces umbrinus]
MESAPAPYDPNISHAVLSGALQALRNTQGRGAKLGPFMRAFLVHYG